VTTTPQEPSEDNSTSETSTSNRDTDSDIEELSEPHTSDTSSDLTLAQFVPSDDSAPPTRSNSSSSVSDYGTPEINTPGPSRQPPAQKSETPVARPPPVTKERYQELRKKNTLTDAEGEELLRYLGPQHANKTLQQQQGRSTRFNPEGVRNFLSRK